MSIISKEDKTKPNTTTAKLNGARVSVRSCGRGYVFDSVSTIDTSNNVLSVFIGKRLMAQFLSWEAWNAS